ncbi:MULTISPECIES: hypothetical protein [unclassified Mesorhizobium]|uniref:hypothetical protein n=1 Tax=unclassified Mesorhizobium TaxID=325217 RepID=UPI00112ACA6F|nr:MULTISPECIES: hypothetical protein [unclassified Mesorhizobium]TPK93710.1 hypothetical protein FJ567_25745 [Mesorhizobium sp. B2-4-16]TPL60579.1 hypothetical protein FJ956_27720 [Mesorhizobium sp. B2-4-3]
MKQAARRGSIQSAATIRPVIEAVGADVRLSRPADCKQPHTAVPENRMHRGCLPHARYQSKHAHSEAGGGGRNRCSASSIKTRIFRDFSGSGEARLAATEFPHFRKPLHFKEKYVYIE